MRRLVSTALIAGLAWSVEAAAGDYFRITFSIDRSGPKEIRLIGRIFNEASIDAVNVRLRVQAIDAAGNVLSEPSAFVDRLVQARSEGYWEASLPPDPRINGFRVVVVGYKFRIQGP